MSLPITVIGIISTASDIARTRLTAVFELDSIENSFTCTIVPSIQNFVSSNATLTFTDVNEISGTKRYTGHIGKADLSLDLGNGTVIVGTLDTEINSADPVAGTGTWTQA